VLSTSNQVEIMIHTVVEFVTPCLCVKFVGQFYTKTPHAHAPKHLDWKQLYHNISSLGSNK
jgi:hypothetical protein